MPRNERSWINVQLTVNVATAALIHKLMVTGLYHARLSQAEFDNARRGQAILENLLLQTSFYSESELRMVLDSTAKIITVTP